MTRLIMHPALEGDKMSAFRRELERLRGVLQIEGEYPEDPTSPLLVSHTVDTSLLGSLLAIPGLDFRLVGRGEDFLEIEVLETSLLQG